MARITLRQLLDHAADHAYGVPAFNISNMEQGLAIMAAAKARDGADAGGLPPKVRGLWHRRSGQPHPPAATRGDGKTLLTPAETTARLETSGRMTCRLRS